MSGSEDFRVADNTSITAVEAKAPSNALDEVLDFCSQTVQHPEARIRQTGTVIQGILYGGIKDIPNELMNHPLETCGKVIVAGGLGAAAGAALALEIPAVTAITIGAGLTMLGVGVYDSFNRMSSNKQLQTALHSIWVNPEPNPQAVDLAEKVLGPEAFNWGVTLPAGLVGGFGGNIATKMVAAKLLSGKPAVIPVDTPEVIPIPAETTVTKTSGAEQNTGGTTANNNSPSLEGASSKHPQSVSNNDKAATALSDKTQTTEPTGSRNYVSNLKELAGKTIEYHKEYTPNCVQTEYTDGTIYRKSKELISIDFPDGKTVYKSTDSDWTLWCDSNDKVSRGIAALDKLHYERLNSADEGIRPPVRILVKNPMAP